MEKADPIFWKGKTFRNCGFNFFCQFFFRSKSAA